MSRALTVELSDATFHTLRIRAEAAAQSPAELAAAALEQRFGTSETNGDQSTIETAEKTSRFERHFGAVNLGHPTGVDNEGIDADLARAYAENHETS
jgi:predicted transcriptional regulator